MDKLAIVLQILQEVNKLLEGAKGLGLDLSGVKLHTSSPIDLLSFLSK